MKQRGYEITPIEFFIMGAIAKMVATIVTFPLQVPPSYYPTHAHTHTPPPQHTHTHAYPSPPTHTHTHTSDQYISLSTIFYF